MIEIKNLTKSFGSLTAVNNLSFSIPEGQILGFLGPNGAGKSTTMKMIAGFLTPTSGSVSVCGFDVESQAIEAKRCIGYLPEGAPGYGEMTPLQFLNFIADVRELSGSHRKEQLDTVVGRLHLDQVLHQSIDTLSKGYRRRVGLAQALLHDPKVLILDEPTDGLDPNQKHEVRELIGHLARDKIVIVSTHILEEVDAVCDRAIIIARGKVLADATPAELEAKSQYHNAVKLAIEELDAAVEAVSRIPEVMKVEVERESGRLIAIPRAGHNPFTAITKVVQENGWSVDELSMERGRLDEVFRQITQGSETGEVRS
ncbi:MAG: ATP-binding cassette domain-containing protein [Xanthomonadales bacterium]|nr:ATP-binding cassette domain-containing protein [Xanthomonadales bacterium]